MKNTVTTIGNPLFLKAFHMGFDAGIEFSQLGNMKIVGENVDDVKVNSVKVKRAKGKRMPWTEEEKQILVSNLDLSNKELCVLLPNRKGNNITAMKSYLGLKKKKVEEKDNGLAKLNQ